MSEFASGAPLRAGTRAKLRRRRRALRHAVALAEMRGALRMRCMTSHCIERSRVDKRTNEPTTQRITFHVYDFTECARWTSERRPASREVVDQSPRAWCYVRSHPPRVLQLPAAAAAADDDD
jgi:hypothetical protein